VADKVWFFDLDDTWMDTAEIYVKQIKKAFLFLKKQLRDQSPTEFQFMEKQREIDSALRFAINPVTREPYYYSMKRFPLSLVKTYEFFCKQTKLDPSYEVQQEFEKIGMGVYLSVEEYRKKIKREVKELLVFLKERGDTVVLVTKGAKIPQRKKIKALRRAGLMKHVSFYRIVKDKSAKTFRDLKRRLTVKSKKRRFYSVGNEYSSDIETAIEAGCFGIWIPAKSASFWEKGKLGKIEEARNKERSNRYRNLLEIKEKYRFLSNA